MFEGLKALFKNARRGPLKGVLVCPRCGSKNVKRLHGFGWLVPQQYYCKDCGYVGYFLVAVEEDKYERRED